MTEQVIVDRASARRQKSSARVFFLAMSMRTSVSTNVLGSVATTLQAPPQHACIGLPVTDIRPPFPDSTEWGFEKALLSCALQPRPVLLPDSRFSKRPNDITNNAQPGLWDKL